MTSSYVFRFISVSATIVTSSEGGFALATEWAGVLPLLESAQPNSIAERNKTAMAMANAYANVGRKILESRLNGTELALEFAFVLKRKEFDSTLIERTAVIFVEGLSLNEAAAVMEVNGKGDYLTNF